MSSRAETLTEAEDKLLRAAATHARAAAAGPDLEIRRIAYGFATNLPEYGEAIVDAAHKTRWEAALKRLLASGFLRQTDAGHQCWRYAVTEKGFAAIPEC